MHSILSEKEVARLLEDFEAQTNIFSLSHKGVSVWQILRVFVAGQIQKLKVQKSKFSRKEFYCAILRGVKFWRLLSLRNKYLACSLYSGIRVEREGFFEDVWFDELLTQVGGGAKLLRCNAPGFSERLSKLKIPAQYDTTFIYFLADVLSKYFPVKDPAFSKISNEVKQLELKLSPETIQRKFSTFYWLSSLWRIFILVARPKAFIVIDTSELALLHACKQSGVKLIELQHGIFTRHHPRALGVNRTENILYPSTFGTYGKYWSDELSSTGLGAKNLISILGSSLIDKYRARQNPKTRSIPQLVFTAQPLDQAEVIRFFSTFSKICQAEFKLFIKLHPANNNEMGKFHDLVSSDQRIEVLTSIQGPETLELIADSDLHLSIASACHYDSLALGTPTYVLKLEGYEQMDTLIQSGHAHLISTPEALEQLISSSSFDKITKAETYFCAPNFCENIKAVIWN